MRATLPSAGLGKSRKNHFPCRFGLWIGIRYLGLYNISIDLVAKTHVGIEHHLWGDINSVVHGIRFMLLKDRIISVGVTAVDIAVEW